MHKTLFNVGKFGKTRQVSLFKPENEQMLKREREIQDSWKNSQDNDMNEELGFHPGNANYGDVDMAKKKGKSYPSTARSSSRSSGRKEIDNDVDAWLNVGGNALFVKIEGTSYMTSIDSVQDLLAGRKKGVKLGQIIE